MTDTARLGEDEQRLAELGYKQELNRSWSGFSNFAISFSIISILAGCFTSFGIGWNNGGPAAIAWGWPTVSLFILVIGLCMSELVSAFPTSGGIYWWASKLGGPKAGLLHRLAQPHRPARHRRVGGLRLRDVLRPHARTPDSTSWASHYSLTRVFVIFIIVLALAAVINIFSSHLLAVLNNVSVWWHVVGASIVVLILAFVPSHHASVSSVFTDTVNNTGFFGGKTERFRVLLLRRPAVVHPDPVHNHRLRRVRAPVGGDSPGSQLRGQGHLAVDLLLPASAAGSCCSASSSQSRTRPA